MNGTLFFTIPSGAQFPNELTLVSISVPVSKARSIVNYLEQKIGSDLRFAPDKEEQLMKIETIQTHE